MNEHEDFSEWARANGLEPGGFSTEQRVLVNASVKFLEFVGSQRLLLRFVAYFLAHCGVSFTASFIGKVVGRTARAVEVTRATPVEKIVEAAHRDGERHGRPTLDPIHAGPVAQFVFEHPSCTNAEIAAFALERLNIEVGIDGVRAFLRRHGLLDLRKKEPVAPLF
jgi:hypothetical protein